MSTVSPASATPSTRSIPVATGEYPSPAPTVVRAPHGRRSLRTGVLERVERTAQRSTPLAVRFAIATVMLWFGIPKFFPGGSSAEDLAVRTIEALTGGLVAGDVARFAIAGLEVIIGIALLIGRAMPVVLLVLLGHMAGTVAPLVLFPAETWRSPMVGTLEGQYILKNIVIIAGAVVLAGYGLRRTRG